MRVALTSDGQAGCITHRQSNGRLRAGQIAAPKGVRYSGAAALSLGSNCNHASANRHDSMVPCHVARGWAANNITRGRRVVSNPQGGLS